MTQRSSECIHTAELEAEIERIQIEKLDLESAKLDFKADKLQWQLITKGRISSQNCNCKKELETERAELNAERVQFENEKSQLRIAQIQLKAAQSHLENVKLEYTAAMSELEIARGHLEAALAQTEINYMKLEAAKMSLVAAKRRFDLATKQLTDAKSKLEDAKNQFDNIAAGSEGGNKCSGLEEENAELRSELAKLRKIVTDLQNDKQKLEAERKENGEEIQRLQNEKQSIEDELKKCRAKAEQERVKIENSKLKNPVVFFDISINGVLAGRIVMELYADTTARKVEIFRQLCTGEKGVSSTGKLLHYKGTSILYSRHDLYIGGGDVTRGNSNEAESIYGGIIQGEGSIRKHNGAGDVTMLHGTSANMFCSFLISTSLNSQLDGEYVLIGKVTQGMEVVSAVLKAWTSTSATASSVLIANSGQIFG